MVKIIYGAMLFLAVHSVSAGIITLESINIDNQFQLTNGQTFKQYWQDSRVGNNLPQQIALDTFTNVRTGQNSLNLLSIEMSTQTIAPLLEIVSGLDAHYGVEAYFNGSNIYTDYRNLWWQRNWDHNAVFTLSEQLLPQTTNEIELFWAERCCDGPSSVMFSVNGAEFSPLNETQLNQAMTISSPAIFSLFLLALGGIFIQTNEKTHPLRRGTKLVYP